MGEPKDNAMAMVAINQDEIRMSKEQEDSKRSDYKDRQEVQ